MEKKKKKNEKKNKRETGGDVKPLAGEPLRFGFLCHVEKCSVCASVRVCVCARVVVVVVVVGRRTAARALHGWVRGSQWWRAPGVDGE